MPFIEFPSDTDSGSGIWPDQGGAAGAGAGRTGAPALSYGDLKSVDRVTMTFAMTEGQCFGAADADPFKSVKLDGVPIRAADGTWNYDGVTLKVTEGAADQLYIPGFPDVEAEYSHGGEVKLGTPLFFNVNSIDANTARVKISVPAFQKMEAQTGKPGPTSAQIKISVSTNGGAYVQQELADGGNIAGTSTGPYVRAYKIALPVGTSHSVKVERLDAISVDTLVANKTYLQGWTEITDVKLRHPYVSLLAISFDAKLFGSIPVVTADWKGILLRVPTNYTPPVETAPGVWAPAVYDTVNGHPGVTNGIWDGTFKELWCASPAWAFFTLATNRRFGAGKYLTDADVDSDELYEISKICDELVTDGMGGQRPRFQCNAYLTSSEESYKVLSHVISCARAQLYYAGGKLKPVQDVETDVVALFSPSNVKGGRFEYQGTAKRARHTMAKVSWWDPAQAFKLTPEPIQHLEGIAKYGVQTIDTTAFGATNLAQARAHGNWALISEQTELEAVAFTSGLEGMAVTIGDIVHVKDPAREGASLAGRLVSATTTALTLDRPVVLQAGVTYEAWVTLNDGMVVSRTITTGAGTVTTVTLTPALPSIPQAENQWQIGDVAAAPSRWRILSIKRPNAHEFEIGAIANNPAKYALADAVGSLVPTVPVPTVFSPVSGLTVASTSTYAQGQAVYTVTAKWTAPTRATGFVAQAQVNGVWQDMAVVGSGASIQVPNAGTFPVRVAALYFGGRSSVVSGSVTATDVYSDGVLSRGAEKRQVQADWVTAQADYLTLGDKATALGISRTAFNAAYTALSDVSTRWSDATLDTVISDLSPALYTRWGTWGKEGVAMQTAITAKAQTDLDAINLHLTRMGDDGYITDEERPELRSLMLELTDEYDDVHGRAVAFSVDSAQITSLETKWAAWTSYATPIIAATGDTAIVRATWDGKKLSALGAINAVGLLIDDKKFAPPTPYSLPVATASVLGGVKAGTNITIDGSGVISATGSGSSTFSAITGQPTDNANLATALALKAPLASPVFTGTVSAPRVLINGDTSGSYALQVAGVAGAARPVFLAGQAGYSNGFTVAYTGTEMAYGMANGSLTVGGGVTATTGTFSGGNVRLDHGYSLTDFSKISFSSSGLAGDGASIRSYRAGDSFGGNEGDLRFYTNTGGSGSSDSGLEALRLNMDRSATFAAGITATTYALPYNTVSTLWGGGYGGAVQILSDNSTATRWARIGIVSSVGAWQGGITIDNNATATFNGALAGSSGGWSVTAAGAAAFTTGTFSSGITATTGTFSSIVSVSTGDQSGSRVNITNTSSGQTWNIIAGNLNVSQDGFSIGYNNSVKALYLTTAGAATFAAGVTATTGDFTGNVSVVKTDARISVRGGGSTSGFLIEQDASKNAYLWNYDNTPITFGINGAQAMQLTSTGLAVTSGVTATGFNSSGGNFNSQTNLVLNPTGSSATYVNYSGGSGGTYFCNGSGGVVATITASGAIGATNVTINTKTNTSAELVLNPYSDGLGTGYQWVVAGANSGSSYEFQVREAGAVKFSIGNSASGNAGRVTTTSTIYSSMNVSNSATYILNNPGALIGLGNYGSGNAKIAQCNASGAWDASYPSTELYLGYANNKVIHTGNIDNAPAVLQALKACSESPLVGPVASKTNALAIANKGRYYFTTNENDTSAPIPNTSPQRYEQGLLYLSDGATWTLTGSPAVITARIKAGAASFGSIGADALAVNTLEAQLARGATLSTSNFSATTGGTTYNTTTNKIGSVNPDNVTAGALMREGAGGDAGVVPVLVSALGIQIGRARLREENFIFNRVTNGQFYQNLTPWTSADFAWNATNANANTVTGSALETVTGNAVAGGGTSTINTTSSLTQLVKMPTPVKGMASAISITYKSSAVNANFTPLTNTTNFSVYFQNLTTGVEVLGITSGTLVLDGAWHTLTLDVNATGAVDISGDYVMRIAANINGTWRYVYDGVHATLGATVSLWIDSIDLTV